MTSERNKTIFQLQSEGLATFGELGQRFGISAERVRAIFRKEKERAETQRPTETILIKALARFGLENPAIPEIKALLQKLEDESMFGWESGFMKASGCGRTALREMRDFAECWAILPSLKPREALQPYDPFPSDFRSLNLYTRLAVQRYTGKEEPSLEDLRGMLQDLEECSGGWKAGFLKIEMGNARSRKELEILAKKHGVLP